MIDARGNPVSTGSAAALAHAETALWRMVSFFHAPIDDLKAASAADPAWALPHILRAGFFLSLTEPALVADAQRALAQARRLATHATERERMHLDAAQTCADGDWHGACARWQAILDRHPRDLAALQWAHLFDFYRGDALALQSRAAQVLPEWDRSDALQPYLLGLHAFGLEECGRYDQAEAVGRQALAGPAKVPWATHAVAHVMEMQGRFEAGAVWLRERESTWGDDNGFAIHHWWHLALFQIEGLDGAAALALYDRHLGSANAVVALNRIDGAALLWRLHLLGADVGTRWFDVATGWDLSAASVGHSSFNDMHAVLVLIGQQRLADAQALVTAAQQHAQAAPPSQRALLQQLGLPLLHGMLAFGRDDFAAAVAWIAPLRSQLHRLGGSHAQRDLVAQTLLLASARAREAALFNDLMQQRRQKPLTPLTEQWSRAMSA